MSAHLFFVSVAVGSLLNSAGFAATAINTNLVTNPGGESPAGATSYNVAVAPAGWTTTGSMTVVRYDIGSASDLNAADSADASGGLNYFAGGPGSAESTASQLINLSDIAPLLATGQVSFSAGALLGGYLTQEDTASLRLEFRNAANAVISSTTTAPVTAATRANQTLLQPRLVGGSIPAGTTAINIVLTATRTSGSYNDGYADNVFFRINAPAGDATLDQAVNFDDLLVVAQNYNLPGRSWTTGDFDRDGSCKFEDLLILAQNYGFSSAVGGSFESEWALAQSLVPEPALLGVCPLAGTLLRRRR